MKSAELDRAALAARTVATLCAIPSVFKAQLLKCEHEDGTAVQSSLKIQVYYSVLNYADEQAAASSYRSTIRCVLAQNTCKVVDSTQPLLVPEHEKFHAASPTGAWTVVGYNEPEAKDSRSRPVLQIWRGKALYMEICPKTHHGAILSSTSSGIKCDVFSTVSWDEERKLFVYMAERLSRREGLDKFQARQSWGETVANVYEPVACLLDLEAGSVRIVDYERVAVSEVRRRRLYGVAAPEGRVDLLCGD